MTRFALSLLLALAGCASQVLPPPLRRVLDVPGLPPDLLVTVGQTILCRDWEAWQAAHPAPLRGAVLLHEAVHARRQIALGLGTWLLRYALEPGFAWEEEKLGWQAEIDAMHAAGRPLAAVEVFAALWSYGPWPYGRIASEAEVWSWALTR